MDACHKSRLGWRPRCVVSEELVQGEPTQRAGVSAKGVPNALDDQASMFQDWLAEGMREGYRSHTDVL
jgi:hypothetical protein